MAGNDSESESAWQREFSEIKHRGARLLQSGVLADCTFIVGAGGACLQAHKLLLAAASEVFENLFYGTGAEGAKPVSVPDMEPDAFRAMLDYIYTDNINLASWRIACDVYCGANKYVLLHLKNECVSYLTAHLSPDSVYRTYEVVLLYKDDDLIDKCLHMMQYSTTAVLKANTLVEAKLETLVQLFALEPLEIESELQLLEAAERYAKAHKQRQENQDLTIRNALQLIRFLTLETRQLARIQTSSALLSATDVFALQMNVSSSNTQVHMPEGFSTCVRKRNQIAQRQTQRPRRTESTAMAAPPAVNINRTDKARKEAIFRVKIENIRQLEQQRYESPEFHMKNLPWRILAYQQEEGGVKMFGFYVECNWMDSSDKWSCDAEVELKVLSCRNDQEPYIRTLTGEFKKGSCGWGLCNFMEWDKLLDPAEGYIKKDAVKVEVCIQEVADEFDTDSD